MVVALERQGLVEGAGTTPVPDKKAPGKGPTTQKPTAPLPPKGTRPAPALSEVASGKALLQFGMVGKAVAEVRDLLARAAARGKRP